MIKIKSNRLKALFAACIALAPLAHTPAALAEDDIPTLGKKAEKSLKKGQSKLKAAIKERNTAVAYRDSGAANDPSNPQAAIIYNPGTMFWASCNDARDSLKDFNAVIAYVEQAQSLAASQNTSLTDTQTYRDAAENGINLAHQVMNESCGA